MSNDIFAKVVVDEFVVRANPSEYKVSAIINDPVSKVTINKDSSVAVFRYVSTNPESFSVDITAPSSVFDVSGGPITSNGVIDISFTSQGKNTVLASPDGSSGLPSFRSLVLNDIPDLSSQYISEVQHDSTLSGKGTVGDPLTVVTGGTVGTVTSIGFDSSDLSISGSPITSAGTVTINLNSTGASAGTYGSKAEVPVITIDSKGRIIDAYNQIISLPTQYVTSVGINSATLNVTNTPITSSGNINVNLNNTGVTSGIYGDNLRVPQITVDQYGRVIDIENVVIGIPGAGIGTVTSVGLTSVTLEVSSTLITSTGLLEVNLYPTTVNPGSYTNADITVDKYGRITDASNGNPGIPPGGLTSQVLTYNASNTLVWVYADGGTW